MVLRWFVSIRGCPLSILLWQRPPTGCRKRRIEECGSRLEPRGTQTVWRDGRISMGFCPSWRAMAKQSFRSVSENSKASDSSSHQWSCYDVLRTSNCLLNLKQQTLLTKGRSGDIQHHPITGRTCIQMIWYWGRLHQGYEVGRLGKPPILVIGLNLSKVSWIISEITSEIYLFSKSGIYTAQWNLSEGDEVLIQDANQVRGQWKQGTVHKPTLNRGGGRYNLPAIWNRLIWSQVAWPVRSHQQWSRLQLEPKALIKTSFCVVSTIHNFCFFVTVIFY